MRAASCEHIVYWKVWIFQNKRRIRRLFQLRFVSFENLRSRQQILRLYQVMSSIDFAHKERLFVDSQPTAMFDRQ